jgi:hypothetical protein
MSLRSRAWRPATRPDAEAAVLAKELLRAGTNTGVLGYIPWRTQRQQAGRVTMVFSRSAFSM